MGRSSVNKRKLNFSLEDREAENDYTIDKLKVINKGCVSRAILLDKSNEVVECADCIEGVEEKVRVKMVDMSNGAYAFPLPKDPNWW